MGGDARTGVLAVGLGLLVTGLAVASVTYLDEAPGPQADAQASQSLSEHEAVRMAGFGVFVLGFLVLAASMGGRTPRHPGRR